MKLRAPLGIQCLVAPSWSLLSAFSAIGLCACMGALDSPPRELVPRAATSSRALTSATVSGDAADDSACPLPEAPISFAEIKGPVQQLSAACAPSWTEEQLATGFAAIRDARLFAVPERPDFLRRIPWLSADTGCEERALAAQFYLESWGYPLPYFVRAQGKRPMSLALLTDNEPDGKVAWSSHVAPVVQVAGQLVVLDPALDPRGPLSVQDWLSLFTPLADVDVAVCRDHEAREGCFDVPARGPQAPQITRFDVNTSFGLTSRLDEEWRVQEMLGRDPLRSLGECPPWASCPLPEPLADPSRAPSITRFLSSQYAVDGFGWPIYIVGDNFIPGLTTIHITGDGIDTVAALAKTNLRRILIEEFYPAGTYQVSAANGTLTSPPVSMVIEE